jgi:hypothetical protein
VGGSRHAINYGVERRDIPTLTDSLAREGACFDGV